MRIEALAAAAGVAVEWKPFLLGPIFKAQGWDTSPFNLYPAKGRYMVRDLERLAAERDLRFALPAVFPQNSLCAARLALVGSDEGWIAPFTRAVYVAEFGAGADISDGGELRSILDGLHLDSEQLFSRIEQSDIKARLKQQTADAQARGIFGALVRLSRRALLGRRSPRARARLGRARLNRHSSRIHPPSDRIGQGSTMETAPVHKTLFKTLGISVATAALALMAYGASAQEKKEPAKKPPPAASICKGLEEAACTAKGEDCQWITPKKGKQKPYCKTKQKPKTPAKKVEPKKTEPKK
jgi:2-hydroxychromene-2-carboxylate isomerase